MNRILKMLFFGFVIKPLVFLVLGLNIINRKAFPADGPAIIAANHNSHLDTMVLMSLFPLFRIHKIRPVAAADYFLRNRFLAWFSLNIIGIIPLDRKGVKNRDDLFSECHEALDRNEILVLFPEGSRGKPEQMSEIKKGLFHLVKNRNNTNITPVVMHGLGRSLPRGEALLVPFNCDVIIGDRLPQMNNPNEFVQTLAAIYTDLFKHCLTHRDIE